MSSRDQRPFLTEDLSTGSQYSAIRSDRRNEVVYAQLRANLVAKSLQPGLVLTESAVARAFNVSRSPASAALERLFKDGLITALPGRGFIVGGAELSPVRKDLFDGGLKLSGSTLDDLEKRGWRERLYPRVEREVAACLAFGSFRIVGASLAETFGVSRTVAQELLTGLERVGLVAQAANGHWFAPQLTEQGVRDHYQVRSLLEPVALVDVAESLDPREIEVKLKRLEELQARPDGITEAEITQAENDLHRDIVLRCSNAQMRMIIHRSQLPLIATHLSFERHLRRDETRTTLRQHTKVFKCLKSGRVDEAAEALRVHLKAACLATLKVLKDMPPIPATRIPRYLTPADGTAPII